MIRWIPLPALLSALLLSAALLPASAARADEPPAPDASPAPLPAPLPAPAPAPLPVPGPERTEAEQLRREVELLAQRMAELQERLRALGGRAHAMPRFELDAADQEALERAARRSERAREALGTLFLSGPSRGGLEQLGPQVERAVREALASLGLEALEWTDGALVLKSGARLSASDLRAKLDLLRAAINERVRALLPEGEVRVEIQGQPLGEPEGGPAERTAAAPHVVPSDLRYEAAALRCLEDALQRLQPDGLTPAQLEAARAEFRAAYLAALKSAPVQPPSALAPLAVPRGPVELHVRLPDSHVEARLLRPDGRPLPGALVAPRPAVPAPAAAPGALAGVGAEMAAALQGLSEAVRALRDDVRALRESLVRPEASPSGPR